MSDSMRDSPPIYLLPGMTADYPVYARLLPLVAGASVAPYIDPLPNESFASYAARMAPRFTADCYLGGISFGGIVALEIARLVRPRGCILISSIRSPRQLPPWFRIGRALGGRNSSRLLGLFGDAAALVPARIRTGSTIRVAKLSGSSGAWHRWATSAVLDWQPEGDFAFPILHIHGDADQTFPLRYVRPDIVVHGGRHALTVSHPIETANAINAFVGVA